MFSHDKEQFFKAMVSLGSSSVSIANPQRLQNIYRANYGKATIDAACASRFLISYVLFFHLFQLQRIVHVRIPVRDKINGVGVRWE